MDNATRNIKVGSVNTPVLASASARIKLDSVVRYCGIVDCRGCSACFVNRIAYAVSR